MAKRESKKTNVSSNDIISLINKSAGVEVAYDLRKSSPATVKYWIPTGSRWLDSIILKGGEGGIPGCKISSIAGLSGTGKSYLAAQIAANAQKMGIHVVYFDSEVAVDPVFLEDIGIDKSKFTYVIPDDVEQVFEVIEEVLKSSNERVLFVWDSLAFTESRKGLEADINPTGSVALIPRILSIGFKRLLGPLARKESTLLILNQLKTRIATSQFERNDVLSEPYTTPGGLSPKYSYSLEIWLTKRKSKAALRKDSNDFVVGSEVKAKIKKSRFGSEHRECVFDIEWGEQIRICDEESWFDAIQKSDRFKRSGAWYSLADADGNWTNNFRSTEWMEKLEDPDFKSNVLQIMDEELIYKFSDKRGTDTDFFDIESALIEEDPEREPKKDDTDGK